VLLAHFFLKDGRVLDQAICIFNKGHEDVICFQHDVVSVDVEIEAQWYREDTLYRYG
jgi:hypothetical protein